MQPDLIGDVNSHGVAVYDSKILRDLSLRNNTNWVDLLWPQIFHIHAVICRHMTVFKFTIQHAAGDASSRSSLLPARWSLLTRFQGLYRAAEAYCLCLHRDISKRVVNKQSTSTASGDYSVKPRKLSDRQIRSSLGTRQNLEWWDICTSNRIFPLITLARKWRDSKRVRTCWQTIHLPEHILEEWRAIALEKGVKASNFDLLASWTHLVCIQYVELTMKTSAFADRTNPESCKLCSRS